jgi:hypothetical protein
MTFESGNRATGIRLVCLGQFLLFWLSLLAYAYFGAAATNWEQQFAETAVVGASLSALHWAVVGLFVATEEDVLSKRVRRSLPRSPLLRVLYAPLLPGGARGFLYLLLNVLALLGVGWWIVWTYLPSELEHQRFMICLACYLLIYLGIGCALGRWCAAVSHDIRPGHIRVLTLILFAVGCIGPYVPLLFQYDYGSSFHPVMITNPLATLIHVADNRAHSAFIVPVLAVGAGLAVLVNVPAMFRGVREVVLAESGPKPRPVPLPATATT